MNFATHNYFNFTNDTCIENSVLDAVDKYGIGSCGPRAFYGTFGKYSVRISSRYNFKLSQFFIVLHMSFVKPQIILRTSIILFICARTSVINEILFMSDRSCSLCHTNQHRSFFIFHYLKMSTKIKTNLYASLNDLAFTLLLTI